MTSRRKMPKEEVQRLWEEKRKVMTDKNANIEDILKWSSWGRGITDWAREELGKFASALSQLWGIQKQISDMKTWPIVWKLRSMNPRDTDANVLKAQLTALIPTIARGVYGEVWVLTDNDIRLYAQTIPNLKWTENINKWVLAFTLDILAWWYKTQLQSLAGSNYDVSGLEWMYNNIKWQAEALKTEIWIWTTQQQTTQQNPQQTTINTDKADDYLASLWL
jgi:hypothetical protein